MAEVRRVAREPVRYLVAVDESSASMEAFEHVLQLATPEDLVFFVHVLDSGTAEAAWVDDARQQSGNAAVVGDYEIDARREEILERFLHRGHAHKVACSGRTRRGSSVGFEICQEAERLGADVIAVGSQKMGALARALLGSVTDYVLHNAPCSVLVIQPRS